MAKRKAKDEAAELTLVMKDGRRLNVLSECGKYYRCEGTQFRKSNPMILRVERKEVVEDADF